MRVYSLRSRNPVVAIVLVLAALIALAAAFMVGIILMAGLAVAGVLLGAGFLLRRNLGRGGRELPHDSRFPAALDPALEVRPDRPRISAAGPADSTDTAPPK